MAHEADSTTEDGKLRVRLSGDWGAASPAFQQMEQLAAIAPPVLDEFWEPFRPIMEALRPVLEGVQPFAQEFVDAFKFEEGTFLADFLLLLSPSATDSERADAAKHLAARHLRPKTIFHRKRWNRLEGPFDGWRNGRSFEEGWEDLIVAHIFDACEIAQDCTLREAFGTMRCQLRSAIEKELLGRTLDTGDVAERLAFDPAEGRVTPDEILEHAEFRVDALQRLAVLAPEDLALILAYHVGEDDRQELARRHGISYGALRQRVSRIQKTLRL